MHLSRQQAVPTPWDSHYRKTCCQVLLHPGRGALDPGVVYGRRRTESRLNEYAERKVKPLPQRKPEPPVFGANRGLWRTPMAPAFWVLLKGNRLSVRIQEIPR